MGGGERSPPLRGETEWGGNRKTRGFVVQNGVRSNFQNKLLDREQIFRRTQEIGLFQIQNPLPQGFDRIFFSAFGGAGLFFERKRCAHKIVFFLR